MQFYRYWAREKGTVRVGDGPQKVSCVAGSTVSQANAEELAGDKIVKVQSPVPPSAPPSGPDCSERR